MAKVKGPNGQVIDVPEAIASGLVGGGHCEYAEEAAPAKGAKG